MQRKRVSGGSGTPASSRKRADPPHGSSPARHAGGASGGADATVVELSPTAPADSAHVLDSMRDVRRKLAMQISKLEVAAGSRDTSLTIR